MGDFAIRTTALCILAAVWAHAQDTAKVRQFEVASIKPNKSGGEPSAGNPLVYSPGGRFTARNVTLVDVIVRVYPTRRVQMRGGPDWIDSDRFDIAAKAGEAEGEVTPEQWAPMVRALLEDRFHLAFHKETKEMVVDALVPSKKSPNLEKAGDETGVRRGDRGQFIFSNMTVAGLVNTLSNILHVPVVDRTGIAGRFNFTFDPMPYMQGVDPNTPVRNEMMADAVLTAVHEQLGFKLEKQKAPQEIMVIDHAERPAEN